MTDETRRDIVAAVEELAAEADEQIAELRETLDRIARVLADVGLVEEPNQ